MRISHGQLESARHNPVEYLRRAAIPFKGKGPGKFQYVKQAIKIYHDRGVDTALEYLNTSYIRRGFKERGLDQYRGYLLTYDLRFQERRTTVFQVEDQVEMPIGDEIIVGGRIGLLSLVANLNIEVCLFFEHTPVDLFSELRMPLLQHYYARKLRAPIETVLVGAYDFDLGVYSFNSYSVAEIQRCIDEVHALGVNLTHLMARGILE